MTHAAVRRLQRLGHRAARPARRWRTSRSSSFLRAGVAAPGASWGGRARRARLGVGDAGARRVEARPARLRVRRHDGQLRRALLGGRDARALRLARHRSAPLQSCGRPAHGFLVGARWHERVTEQQRSRLRALDMGALWPLGPKITGRRAATFQGLQAARGRAFGAAPLGTAASGAGAAPAWAEGASPPSMRCGSGRRIAAWTSSSGAPATVAITESRRRSLAPSARVRAAAHCPSLTLHASGEGRARQKPVQCLAAFWASISLFTPGCL